MCFIFILTQNYFKKNKKQVNQILSHEKKNEIKMWINNVNYGDFYDYQNNFNDYALYK